MNITLMTPTATAYSLPVAKLKIYLSEETFTPDDLPGMVIYDGVGLPNIRVSNIMLPQDGVMYYLMLEYTLTDGSVRYSMTLPARQSTANERLIWSRPDDVTAGTHLNGEMSIGMQTASAIYGNDFTPFFNTPPPSLIRLPPTVVRLNGETYLMQTNQAAAVTPKDYYLAHLLGKYGSGDFRDQLSIPCQAMFGSPEIQGAIVNRNGFNWNMYLPTLQEMRDLFLTTLLSGVISPPEQFLRAAVYGAPYMYLTSTEDPDMECNFLAIDTKGETHSFRGDTALPPEVRAFYLMTYEPDGTI